MPDQISDSIDLRLLVKNKTMLEATLKHRHYATANTSHPNRKQILVPRKGLILKSGKEELFSHISNFT
jgi:hypothetical protein